MTRLSHPLSPMSPRIACLIGFAAQAGGVRSSSAEPMWHPEAFYTLNEIPR